MSRTAAEGGLEPRSSRGPRLWCLLAALVLGLLPGVVLAPSASACSCTGSRTRSSAERADAIFTGRVLDKERERRPRPGRIDIRFEVSKVYKGTVYQQQVVASPVADGCGIDPEINSSWVIFAEDRLQGTGDETVIRLVAELCSGNLPGTTAPVHLGVGRPPRPGASDREEKATTADVRLTRVVTGSVIVVVGLLVVGGAALAVLWRPGRRRA